MALKVAFQMDPIERIDIRGDSTFALLLEAQWRGHDVFYYTPNNLSLRDGRLIALGHSLTVEDKPGAHYRLAHEREDRVGPHGSAGWHARGRRGKAAFPMASP